MNIFRLRPFCRVAARPSRIAASWLMGAVLVSVTCSAFAQKASDGTGSIYTCVDAQGRRLTSDRPILACNDREQRELSKGGTVKRVLGPTLTAKEREAQETRQREAEMDRQRARDAIRRDESLVNRYPNKAAHDEGRKKALAQSQVVVDAAQSVINDLKQERKGLDEEMEFYKKDPSKAPANVRRAIEANADALGTQQRAIAAQQAERDRINAHFDEQLARLKQLWQAQHSGAGPASAPAAIRPGVPPTR